ncbi:MAG TPA: hypothetical protein PKK37_00200 [Candidatus Pacearchaeota archaeon]|jgi:hypothetical protein|nr:MAG: hypothetical protein YFSK_7070 [Candidatus Yanofskybacteria bacterium]HNR80839.1 hypothetical protein [Candidatus Pacearchaeota archaeon]
MAENKLSEDQILSIIKGEREKLSNPYGDQTDLVVDFAVGLYERKEIDRVVFKTLISLAILKLTQKTVADLMDNLIKRNLISKKSGSDSDEFVLLNYFKKNYG